jgi:pyrroline-5-carboxylate reductase
MNQQSPVGVIGAGIMGEALIAALISSGVNPGLITISEKRADRSCRTNC